LERDLLIKDSFLKRIIMKNLKLADLTKEGPKGAIIGSDLDYVTFHCIKHVTVQPSEIQRVELGLACEVPIGYVLQVSTYPKLVDQASEVFPALTVVDSTHRGELILAVRNHGRNPLSLMPGTAVAIGRIVKTEQLDIEGFEYEAPKLEPRQSKPQKKNPFSFEVK
jgi:dUTPase